MSGTSCTRGLGAPRAARSVRIPLPVPGAGNTPAYHGCVTPTRLVPRISDIRSSMDFIVYLLVLALTGLVVGALGRLAIPGRDPMSIPQTILIGVAASFIAGLVWWLITDDANGGGILLSVIFAALIVYLIR